MKRRISSGVDLRPKCRVGIPQSDYNTQRNIIGSLPRWAKRVRPLDPYRVRTALTARMGRPVPQSRQFSFCEPFLPRVGLLHFFNRVSFARTPWISTFETSLPRWGDLPDSKLRPGLDALLMPACRQVIAISDAAASIARQEWRRLLPEPDAMSLEAKLRILLPPQRILVPEQLLRRRGPVRFAFVGADFYRKGGLEVLEALLRLKERGSLGWKATIIGNLRSFGDYASRTNPSHMQRAKAMLARLDGLVAHVERAPNSTVLDTLQNSHYFLFPTLADTFGYSVLEAQASGAVVIASNVRALPEIVQPDWGFRIDLPLDERREVHRHPRLEDVKVEMVERLEQVLTRAVELEETQRQAMADRAIRNLQSRHCPQGHASAIEATYLAALA